ncbi:protein of unknown function (plasmid) [Cupriavidus taiwanensis]|nr:protein of unknown function [Cupriavidus taiwanensis]
MLGNESEPILPSIGYEKKQGDWIQRICIYIAGSAVHPYPTMMRILGSNADRRFSAQSDSPTRSVRDGIALGAQ